MSKKDGSFKGWKCPRCKQINAPWVPYCDCEEEEEKKSESISWPITTTWTYKPDSNSISTASTPLGTITTSSEGMNVRGSTVGNSASNIHYTMTSLNTGE